MPGAGRGTGHRRPRHRPPPGGDRGLAEIARHALSTPGNPQILDEHYPGHPGGNGPRRPRPRPRTPEEEAFLELGPGAHRWLIEAAATGTARVRAKMAHAVELAAHLGTARVDQALGLAAMASRFADDDLAAICDHLATEGQATDVVIAAEKHSAQPGTGGWATLDAGTSMAGMRADVHHADR